MPFVAVTGRQIEYRMIPGDHARPTLVFLHEGLGSATLWRDFPDKVAGRLGARALVYSRFGYGQSDGLAGERSARSCEAPASCTRRRWTSCRRCWTGSRSSARC